MKDTKRLTQLKMDYDRNAYRKGFEEGGFAGAFSITLIFLFVVFVIVPLVP
jgi:hypothetical protein